MRGGSLKILSAGIFLQALVLICTAEERQVNVRVRESPAGPQIFVDGSPRAPRMVWVRNTVVKQPVGAQWRSWSAALTPTWDVTSWRFAIHAEHKPGLLQVRKVQLVGSDGSVVPVCEAKDLCLEAGKFNDHDCHSVVRGAAVLKKGVSYTVSLEVRAEGGITWFRAAVEPVMGDGLYHYWLEELSYADGRLMTSFEQVRAAAAVGVDFVTYPAGDWLNAGWEGESDWADVDACADLILSANPKALLIPRVFCAPPEKWFEKHPNALMKAHDGSELSKESPSIHYRPYREALLRNLEAFARHMMAKYPRNFAGIHPSGQNTGEWFYENSQTRMCGYDRSTLEAWRRWLKSRGAPDADRAVVPPPEERRRNRVPARFFDPADPVQARCVEFLEFLNVSMADFLNDMHRVCRRATEGQKLVVNFYGYTWEMATVHQGPANTGHYALMKLLREGAENLDILVSPLSYSAGRQWCGSTPMMSAVETAQRRGILWVHEDDSRTHLDQRRASGVQERGTSTRSETHDLMRRNNAFEAVRGCGGWWMDLWGHGWYSDPVVWQTIPEERDFEVALMARRSPYRPDVALIADERSMMSLNFGGKCASAPLFTTGRQVFALTGTGYGQYLEEDVVERPIEAKLQIHLSAWRVTDTMLNALVADRTARPEVTRVWCWAPGYVGERGFDVGRTRTLTGFHVREISSPTLDVVATKAGLDLGFPQRLGLRDGYKGQDVAHLVAPKLAVVPEKGDVVLANWTDGTAAVVARRNAGGRGWNVFYGPTVFTLGSANALVRISGVHSYLERPDGSVALFADGDHVALQAQKSTSPMVVWPSGKRLPLSLRQGEVRTIDRIRFASWNVGHFSNGVSGKSQITADMLPKSLEQFRTTLVAADADVVGIAEYASHFDADGRLPTPEALFGSFRHRILGTECGHYNSLFVRGWDLIGSGCVHYKTHYQPAHYTMARVKVGGRVVAMAMTHLEANLKDNPRAREMRAAQMREVIAAVGDASYAIVAGDFNVLDQDEYQPFVDAGFAAANHGTPTWPTPGAWPGAVPQRAFDNIFARGFEISDFRVVNSPMMADHCLIRCTLDFVERNGDKRD